MSLASLVCKVRGHRLDGPEASGTILCSRCSASFDADFLRSLGPALRARGYEEILGSAHETAHDDDGPSETPCSGA